jgi:hypothetical protein
LFKQLGTPSVVLLACFWYIKFLSERHEKERVLWMEKDSESDRALREIMRESNQILSDMRSVLTEQTTLLRSLLHTDKKNG